VPAAVDRRVNPGNCRPELHAGIHVTFAARSWRKPILSVTLTMPRNIQLNSPRKPSLARACKRPIRSRHLSHVRRSSQLHRVVIGASPWIGVSPGAYRPRRTRRCGPRSRHSQGLDRFPWAPASIQRGRSPVPCVSVLSIAAASPASIFRRSIPGQPRAPAPQMTKPSMC